MSKFKVSSSKREELIDITSRVVSILKESGLDEGLCNVYVRHATAALMIQENWDDSVQKDVVNLLKELIPRGKWLHDKQDGNGDSHLKSGLIGPSVSVPFRKGSLLLGKWQNIFLCEFDGPKERTIVITLIPL